MSANQSVGLPQDLHYQIVYSSCQLLSSVQNVLRPSSIPGRQNYMFSLRDVARLFQVCCILISLNKTYYCKYSLNYDMTETFYM